MVENNADVNKTDNGKFSPLYYATQMQELKIIKFLIESGANAKLAANTGDQPIHMAAMLCNIFIIKILLENDVNVDVANNSGNTALHQVLLETNQTPTDKKIEAVKYLLAHSAKTDIQNNENKTALDLAKHYCQDAVPFFEHPEQLPTLVVLEQTLIGDWSYADL